MKDDHSLAIQPLVYHILDRVVDVVDLLRKFSSSYFRAFFLNFAKRKINVGESFAILRLTLFYY